MAACQNEGQIVADQVHGLSPDRPDENNNFLRAAEQTLFEIAVKTAEDVRRER